MSASFENSCAPETRSLIASRLSTENRHFRLYLTPVEATWLTYRERSFKWVTATGINLIIFEFANLWLDALNEGQVYPWVHRWRLILLVHIYTTHTLFRLSSGKVSQDYLLLRTFVWCLMEKLTPNNGPFLDT